MNTHTLRKTKEPLLATNPDAQQPYLQYGIFIFYILLVCYGVYTHEPWRDEAQAWLLVRDTNLHQLMGILPTEGHPPLWYFLLFPLVKSGLPYVWQNYLCAAIMIAAVYVLLFKTKFPPFLKLVIPFSYFFLYEYAIFARNYSLVFFCSIAIVSLYPHRFSKPWLYALALAALFNSHILAFGFAFALLLCYFLDAYHQKRLNTNVISAILAVVVTGVYLIPFFSSEKILYSFSNEIRNNGANMLKAIQEGLSIDGNPMLAIVLLIIAITGLAQNSRPMFIATSGIAWLLYVLGFKYTGSVRHAGIIFIVLLTAYGIQQHYQPQYLLKRSGIFRYSRWVLVAIVLLQLKPMAESYMWDINEPYSDSKAAATFIKENQLEQKIIIGQQAWAVSSILPYLPHVKQVYYPECERYGTYYVYDTCFLRKRWQFSPDYVMNITYNNFRDKLNDLVIVVNYPLKPVSLRYVDLLYSSNEETIREDEMFYIYKFKDGIR